MKKKFISILILIPILLISILILIIANRDKKDLLQLLKSSSDYDQWKGTALIIEGKNLEAYDEKQIVEHLLPLLSSRQSWIKENAIHSLRILGPSAKESVPLLISLLDDPDVNIQAAAIMALGKIKSDLDLTIPALIEYASRDNKNRWLVYQALADIGPDAIDSLPHIKASLNHENEMVRACAKYALKSITRSKKKKPVSVGIHAQEQLHNKTIVAVDVLKAPDALTYNLNFVIRNDLNLKHEFIIKSLLKEKRNDLLREGIPVPKYAILVFSFFHNPGENPENGQIIITQYRYVNSLDDKKVLETVKKIDNP